ncbi:MAG TPA: dihydrofolate reductase family protein [Candidatus Saccharimonadales bacterium]|jgi:dihydrofolate reductase|nr:dihydrofolate reductase family protein [Candidatus Saccharimonadales bacterium]
MKITLIAAISVNGKMTDGDQPDVRVWTSPEDDAVMAEQLAAHRLLVMGRKTYEAVRPRLKLSMNKQRIILTHTPSAWQDQAVPGKLEFTDESPEQIVQRSEAAGHDAMLIVGGGYVNAAFMAAGLVDELYITVEPVVFGAGVPLFEGALPTTALRLLEAKTLNERGTHLLHYVVMRER